MPLFFLFIRASGTNVAPLLTALFAPWVRRPCLLGPKIQRKVSGAQTIPNFQSERLSKLVILKKDHANKIARQKRSIMNVAKYSGHFRIETPGYWFLRQHLFFRSLFESFFANDGY